jgi:glutamate 5-kinase
MIRSRKDLGSARRIVVKAGTQVLLSEDGFPSLGRIFALVEALAALRRQGREVLLVSSGAVGLGARRLGLKARPGALALQQACAAVGQGELMSLYQTAFGRLDTVCAQVLLTQEDFSEPERRDNLRATLGRLLKMGVIPVINENDTVATLELGRVKVFGDNDKLSALVAAGMGADLLLILSDVDGLHAANPHHHPRAPLLAEVAEVTPEILALARGGGARGRGGMATKLESAGLGMAAGVAVVIARGEQPGIVQSVVRGEAHGTLFLPGPRPGGDPLQLWLAEVDR